jgi:hypothetical protein
VDNPGQNGGLLSQGLNLAVEDLTKGVTIFSGQLGVLDDRALGALAAGEARTYRFTATLPDGGAPLKANTGDNAYMGSSVTVRYAWRASAPEGFVPSVTPTEGPPKVTYRVRTKNLFKRGRFIGVIVRCDRPCRVTTYAKMPKLRRGVRQKRTRSKSVTIVNPSRPAGIRLRVTKRTKKQLKAKLARRGRITMRVHVAARSTSSAAGAPATTLSRRVTVKRKLSRRQTLVRALAQLRQIVP